MKKINNYYLVKNILFLLVIFLISNSCSPEQPECSGDDVKEVLFDIVKEQLQKQLEENYFDKNYNYGDIKNYANDNNLDFDELNNEVEIKIRNEAEEYALSKISKAECQLKDIRALSVKEDIKKCDCAAVLIIKNIEIDELDFSDMLLDIVGLKIIITDNMEIRYTAQYTEDERVYVELYY